MLGSRVQIALVLDSKGTPRRGRGWTLPVPNAHQDHPAAFDSGLGDHRLAGFLRVERVNVRANLHELGIRQTVTVGVATFARGCRLRDSLGIAGGRVIASSIPLIALVVIFQKRIVAGLPAGASK